jgi:hypothetical protein
MKLYIVAIIAAAAFASAYDGGESDSLFGALLAEQIAIPNFVIVGSSSINVPSASLAHMPCPSVFNCEEGTTGNGIELGAPGAITNIGVRLNAKAFSRA